MEMRGSRRIAAPRAVVWAALNDPRVLKAAIPGCRSLTGTAAHGLDAVVQPKVGPLKATLEGRLWLEGVVPGERYVLLGKGKGRAGVVSGRAVVTLADDGAGTLLGYDVTAEVGGRLAELGTTLVDNVAGRIAEAFFRRLQAAAEREVEREGGAADPGDGARKPGWFRRVLGA